MESQAEGVVYPESVNYREDDTLPLWPGHAQIITDFIGEKFLDDAMSWYSGERAIGRILVYHMFFTFAPQQTAMGFEMADQICAVHFMRRAVSFVHV
ncbi:MAG: hypothetical protein J2P52_01620 [Blastocatellia bacterium]|nr:hypothetical protein [Blastocatellia bacterium]